MGSPHRIRLRSFHNAQRVKVVDAVKNPAGLREETVTLNALGAVSRIRSDGGAWIRLDERSKVSSVHPFPESDSRSNNVLAYPEDCEAPTKTRADGNRKARRSNKKEVDKAATDEAVPPPTIASFGKDRRRAPPASVLLRAVRWPAFRWPRVKPTVPQTMSR